MPDDSLGVSRKTRAKRLQATVSVERTLTQQEVTNICFVYGTAGDDSRVKKYTKRFMHRLFLAISAVGKLRPRGHI